MRSFLRGCSPLPNLDITSGPLATSLDRHGPASPLRRCSAQRPQRQQTSNGLSRPSSTRRLCPCLFSTSDTAKAGKPPHFLPLVRSCGRQHLRHTFVVRQPANRSNTCVSAAGYGLAGLLKKLLPGFAPLDALDTFSCFGHSCHSSAANRTMPLA